jgi:hypothetical protein
MTSRTSTKAFRLNISNFWENYVFYEKKEYHLLDKKIKAFFSSIIQGFINEPINFWFFKTHFYPFKKKKRFARVLSKKQYSKFRLINLNINKKSYSLPFGNTKKLACSQGNKKTNLLLNKYNTIYHENKEVPLSAYLPKEEKTLSIIPPLAKEKEKPGLFSFKPEAKEKEKKEKKEKKEIRRQRRQRKNIKNISAGHDYLYGWNNPRVTTFTFNENLPLLLQASIPSMAKGFAKTGRAPSLRKAKGLSLLEGRKPQAAFACKGRKTFLKKKGTKISPKEKKEKNFLLDKIRRKGKESSFSFLSCRSSPVEESDSITFSLFVRKHILRALYLPSLVKLKKLPINFTVLNKLHNQYKNNKFFSSSGGKEKGEMKNLKSTRPSTGKLGSGKQGKPRRNPLTGKTNTSQKESKIGYKGKTKTASSPLLPSVNKNKEGQELSASGNPRSSRTLRVKAPSMTKGEKGKINIQTARGIKLSKFSKKERALYKRFKKVATKNRSSSFLCSGKGRIAKSYGNINIHRLYLMYKPNFKNLSPIILGKCKVLQTASIAYVNISYYLDLDQNLTTELSTLLIYRLFASKNYLESLLHIKIKLTLTNYFLFIWKLKIYNSKNLSIFSLHSLQSSENHTLGSLQKGQRKIKQTIHNLSSPADLWPKAGQPMASLWPKEGRKEGRKERQNKKAASLPLASGQRADGRKEEKEKKQKRNSMTIGKLLKNEQQFFIGENERINNIINHLSKWKKNRFFKRTINTIIPLFFYQFDSVLVGNLISFELSNLRKGHKNYIYFLKKTLEICFLASDQTKNKFAKYRRSYSGYSFINSIKLTLRGRLTKSRRPSTRTQTSGFTLTSGQGKEMETLNGVTPSCLSIKDPLRSIYGMKKKAFFFPLEGKENRTEKRRIRPVFSHPAFGQRLVSFPLQPPSLRKAKGQGNARWINGSNYKLPWLLPAVGDSLSSLRPFSFPFPLPSSLWPKAGCFGFVAVRERQPASGQRQGGRKPDGLRGLRSQRENWPEDVKKEINETNKFWSTFPLLPFPSSRCFPSPKGGCFGFVPVRERKRRKNGKRARIKATQMIITKKVKKNNPKSRGDSYQTISYNRFGIINIELIIYYNH